MFFVELISEEHKDRLPFVRIKKIELTNFKSVEHGVLTLLGDEVVPFNTKSNILGIYGQNGSGKTAIVEALGIVKELLGGFELSSEVVRYIDINAEWASIAVEFEFQYKDGTVASVEYSFKLSRKKRSLPKAEAGRASREEKEFAVISDEIIKTDLYADGIQRRRHPIIDTKDYLLCNDTCAAYFFENRYNDVKDELTYIKRKSADDTRSFILSPDLAELIHTEGINSKYTEILSELNMFAWQFLNVISTRSNAIAQLRQGIPVFIPFIKGAVFLNDGTPIPSRLAELIEEEVHYVQDIISTIIPDLDLALEKSPTKTESGEDAFYFTLYSLRGDKKIPFDYESDGIIKVVSILACYIFAFNQGSTTLIVDELDAGVFEYLLGELLQIFDSDGKGQLIFTSHNLRPLEVLDKNSICFTTSDPSNRYCRLKNIGSTNNLRDQYLKAVQLGNTDVELYKKTKAFKIVKALKKAGKEQGLNE